MTSNTQAGFLAKQGLGYLYSATKASVSAISTSFKSAHKSYADYTEKKELEALKKTGKTPSDLLFEVLQRLHYLGLAGYNNEAAAAAQKGALKMTDLERSSIPLDAVICLGNIIGEIAAKYGDVSKSNWLGLSDFLNSSRMGKDHYDRDNLVQQLYYTVLYLAETTGGVNTDFEQSVRSAAGRIVEGMNYVEVVPGFGGSSTHMNYTPSAYGSVPSALPSYATVPPAGGAPGSDPENRSQAARIISVLASSVKKAGAEAEVKRQKNLKDAQDMLARERERASQRLG